MIGSSSIHRHPPKPPPRASATRSPPSGLVPVDALLDAARYYLHLEGFRRAQVLELRLLEEE